jgi:hypothetical protein
MRVGTRCRSRRDLNQVNSDDQAQGDEVGALIGSDWAGAPPAGTRLPAELVADAVTSAGGSDAVGVHGLDEEPALG